MAFPLLSVPPITPNLSEKKQKKREMPRKNPLSHEKSSHQFTRRRSPRFLPSQMEKGEEPDSKKNQVRPSLISSIENPHSTGEISPKKSNNRRQSLRLINSTNGLRKSSASVDSAPSDPKEKTQFQNCDFSEKQVFSEVNREGGCRINRRRSCRLMGFQMGVEDLSGSSEERVFPKVARKEYGRKERRRSPRSMCFEKGGEHLRNSSEKRISSDVTQKGDDRNGRRRSCRLMGIEKGLENVSGSLEKRVSSEVTQKGDGHKEWRRSVRLMEFEKGLKTLGDFPKKGIHSEVNRKGVSFKERRCSLRLMGFSESVENDFSNKQQSSLGLMDSAGSVESLRDFSEKCVSSGATQKRDSHKGRWRSLRMMLSSKGVEKSEVGIDGHEELERKTDKEVRTGNSVTSVTVVGKRMEGGEKKRRKVESGSNNVGVIERRNEEESVFQGWTKDQEAALQRAYFVAKPSPHFWKKVSKLVPGKSAQECFDRVHSNLLTPQLQPRSRTYRSNSSPLRHCTLSSSKLHENINPDVKRPRKSKQKSLLAQKTVRNMLRKHRIMDQGYEADLFSVLETTTNISTQDLLQAKMPSTPDCVLKPLGFLQKCQERSSSAHKRTLSKFSTASRADLVSPPVLKRVKNMALHEKYIDQLHSREARRKRTASAPITDNTKGSRTDVKAARTALVSDAVDVIRQFQGMQSNDIGDYQYFEDDDDGGDDDCEDGP